MENVGVKERHRKQEVFLFVALCSHTVILSLPTPFPLIPSDSLGASREEDYVSFVSTKGGS